MGAYDLLCLLLCFVSYCEAVSECNWFSVYTTSADQVRLPLNVCTGSHSQSDEQYASDMYRCRNNGTHDYVEWTHYDGSSDCKGGEDREVTTKDYFDTTHFDCGYDEVCPWLKITEYEVDEDCNKDSEEWASLASVLDDCFFGVQKYECTENTYSFLTYVPLTSCGYLFTNATVATGCNDAQDTYTEICCNDFSCNQAMCIHCNVALLAVAFVVTMLRV